MSLFKKNVVYVGIYSIYDPVVKDRSCKFSPPFFAVSDDLACQALCETLRRHHPSFDCMMSSDFLRMELWRLGSVDLAAGNLVARKHHYLVCKLSEYLHRDHVFQFMRSVSYPTQEEINNSNME